MRLAAMAVFPFLLGITQAQTLDVAPTQLDFKMPVGGPLPPVTTLTITSSGDWTLALDTDYLEARPSTGKAGTTTVTVTPVDWRPAGNSTPSITVTSQGITRTVTTKLSVVLRSDPNFVYSQTPNGCQTVQPGLAPDNLAVCAISNLNPPNVGQSYQDPTFGTQVRVLANGYHGYSTPSPISATNKYVLMNVNEDTPTILDRLTGKTVRTVPSSIGFQGVKWDGTNDNYLYGIAGNTIQRMDVSKGSTTTMADYSKGTLRFASIKQDGTGEITRDNWFPFYAPQEGQICTLDLNTATTYCGTVPAGVNVDFPTMSKGIDATTKQRYVIAVVGSGPFLIYAVNGGQKTLDLVGRGPEKVGFEGGNRNGICDAGEYCFNGSHSDTTEDSAGNQFLILAEESQHPCEYSVMSLQLNKGDQMGLPVEVGGGMKRVMTLFRCGTPDKWVDFHMGCAKSAQICALSTTSLANGEAPRDPGDNSPLAASPYIGEIMTIVNNGAEIHRLAKHRSLQFKNEDSGGYWSTSRAAISADGAFIVATTNFGQATKHRVVVIDTGVRNPKIAAGNPVQNAADYSATVAPGTLSILYGSDLAGCDLEKATFPLPKTLCGASIQVEGQPAYMFYASPSQLAFLVPRGITTPKANVAIVVTTTGYYGAAPTSISSTFPVATASPALFANSTGTTVLTLDPSGTERAIHLGEYAIAFGVGLGTTSPFVEDGQPSPVDPLPKLPSPPQLLINNVPQTLDYAGLIPGMSSVYQFNWIMNPATPIRSGDQPNQIWLQDGSVESQRLLIDLLPAVDK